MSTRAIAEAPITQALLRELHALRDAGDDQALRELGELVATIAGSGNSEELLDAAAMAMHLDVHSDTVVRWARSGRIWARKVGREWRFRLDRADVAPASPGNPTPERPIVAPRHNRPHGSGVAATIRGARRSVRT